MATKRNVAKTRARTKPRAEKPAIDMRDAVARTSEKPVDSEIRRAAKRAGIDEQPTPAPATSLLTPEDEALIAWRESAGCSSRVARPLFEKLRAFGYDDERLAAELRGEAHNLDQLQRRLTRRPETESSMLRDALKVIEAAELIFYLEGRSQESPMALLEEAIASAAQEHAVLSVCRNDSANDPVEWQEHWRAEQRLILARRLAAFRTKHGYYEPNESIEPSAEGAS